MEPHNPKDAGYPQLDEDEFDMQIDTNVEKNPPPRRQQNYLNGQMGKAFICSCNMPPISDVNEVADHSISCGFMQKDGYSTFFQFLKGVLDKGPVDDQKIANLRAIFEMQLAASKP